MPDPSLMQKRFFGIHLLFVGRVSPSKGIAALLDAFEAYLCFKDEAHLSIVGRFNPADDYYRQLRDSVIERRMEKSVTFAGLVDDETLTAYYRTADVFVTLSEHEGFCVPLVEAMFWDIPIVALGTTAIPETLGPAGIVLDPSATPLEIGALFHTIFSDLNLRLTMIEAQRKRRTFYFPEAGERLLDGLISELSK